MFKTPHVKKKEHLANYLSFSLSFFTYEMGTMITSASKGCED